MRKIEQGKYEVFTTKENAIDKFRQMQGICREEISGENRIEFFCTKKGKIYITNPSTRHYENGISTKLFAQILNKDGKTYITYYTSFSKANNVLKTINIVIDLLMAIFLIAVIIIEKVRTYYLPIFVLCLVAFGIKLFFATKEEKNSPKDSEILIKELEKRVEAVNLWDK